MAVRNRPSDEDLEAFGARLREVRTDLRLSQTQMADKLGLRLGTYQAYEQGRNDGRISALLPLAALGVDLNWLVVGALGHGHKAGESRVTYTSQRPRIAEIPPKGVGVFNEELLKIVVTEIERTLNENNLELPPEKKGELVAAVYDLAQAEEDAGRRIDRGKVIRLVRLAG